MGFVQKELGNIFVRTDNFQAIRNLSKGKELFTKKLAIKRKGMDLIIYSEYDFEQFYKKHCQRVPNNDKPFTVLVEDDINVPDKTKVRELIEKALCHGNLGVKNNTIIIEIEKRFILPSKFKVRTFFNNQFQDKSREGFFRFRDINDDVKPKELEQLYKEKIITEEYKELKRIRDSSFVSGCNYTIRYILLIGHIDII